MPDFFALSISLAKNSSKLTLDITDVSIISSEETKMFSFSNVQVPSSE